MNNQLAIIVLLVILVVLVAVNIWLYRHYRRNIKKVTFLFDAIDNGDFSFSFPTEKRFKEDKILHQSLNRIKLFLQHTREEQMEREKYYEQILNAVDTGILVVDDHDNILQQQYGFVRLGDSEGSFIVDAYPVSVHYSDVAIIFVTVIAVGWLAVWYPVRALSKRLLS